MSKITFYKPTYLRRLHNAEHARMMEEIVTLLNTHSPAALQINEMYILFNMLFMMEKNHLQQLRKSLLTDKIEAIEESCRNQYRAIKLHLRAELRNNNGANKEAATLVLEVIKKYGNLLRQNYQQRTENIADMMVTIRAKCYAESAQVGAYEKIQLLESYNQTFKTLYDQRTAEKAKNKSNTFSSKHNREATDAAFFNLIEELNVNYRKSNGDQNFRTFLDKMNEITNNYKILLAQRKGYANKRKVQEAAIPSPLLPDTTTT